MSFLRVRGARTHNLKNISLDIPRDKLVVITGLSGSGKSSLAFDTLYAEGQRRYVESLSAYARQFLQLMDKPDVDSIEGLSPAISIEQKATSHNPRSTVGTVTEIHDYLRLLFARAGTPYCPNHPDQALDAQSVSQMVDAVLARPAGEKLMILAPVVSARKGEHAELFTDLQAQGYTRVRVRTESLQGSGAAQAQIIELSGTALKLPKQHKHSIDVVVDRIKVAASLKQRLAESFETALRLADGRAIVSEMDTGVETMVSNRFACPICSFALRELEPRLFSFNNPAGACTDCEGLGTVAYFDAQRVVQFPNLSLAAGAVKGWDRRNSFAFQMLQGLASHYKFDIETPFAELAPKVQQAVLHGSGTQKITFHYAGDGAETSGIKKIHPFEGIVPSLERRWRETDSPQVREELGRLRSHKPCPACKGTRLKPEARHVKLGHGAQARAIFEVSRFTLGDSARWFEALALTGAKATVGERVVREISNRLQFLNDVGLHYLSLDRSADTLSGGEAQRIRLASQIGSGLTGVMYVLDEPSIGLHQRDNDRLITTLKALRDLGNSVLVVEHDEDAIRAADHVIDLGPGAGEHGGQVLAQGTADEVAATEDSLTGKYLRNALRIEVPKKRHPPAGKWLEVEGASGNNLKSVNTRIPAGLFVCITGVSGSGKSTLINDTVLAVASRELNGASTDPAPHTKLSGLEHFDKVIAVDQSPIGRTPRSNPATYTGLFGPIRELFAETPTARERGYQPGRFSFNVKGGRCERCEGDGVLKVEMHFLPDVYVSCDLCFGQRYNRETLEVLYKGRHIAEVLGMTVEQANRFFSAVPSIQRKLQTLLDVGLGYVQLGQSATTLSGGEAQRVKLALELSKRDTGRTLYVLDEPTTGLHFHDIAMLLKVLQALRDAGNTVVVIEHNLDVIKTADWIIDLGPEGGEGGGEIVATGTPEEVARNPASFTGRYLKRLLDHKLV
jgi:excinuclease ABC subunit A